MACRTKCVAGIAGQPRSGYVCFDHRIYWDYEDHGLITCPVEVILLGLESAPTTVTPLPESEPETTIQPRDSELTVIHEGDGTIVQTSADQRLISWICAEVANWLRCLADRLDTTT